MGIWGSLLGRSFLFRSQLRQIELKREHEIVGTGLGEGEERGCWLRKSIFEQYSSQWLDQNGFQTNNFSNVTLCPQIYSFTILRMQKVLQPRKWCPSVSCYIYIWIHHLNECLLCTYCVREEDGSDPAPMTPLLSLPTTLLTSSTSIMLAPLLFL